MDAVSELDALIERLDGSVQATVGDAIDAELARTPRQSAVTPLRDSEIMNRFRQELVDGLIRVDTAAQVLRLVQQVVGAVLAARA
jgi:hypothetical protein